MLRRLAADTALYSLGSLGSGAMGILLLPIYTHYLSVRDYGILETTLITLQLLIIVYNCGLSQAIVRYWREASAIGAAGGLLGSTLAVTLTAGLVGGLVTTVVGGRWYNNLMGEQVGLTVLVALATSAAIRAVHQQLAATFRADRDPLRFVVVNLATGGLWFATCYLFVVTLHTGVAGALWAQTTAFGTVALVTSVLLVRQHGAAVRWSTVRRTTRFGAPLVLAMASWFVMNAANRYFLAGFRTLEEVAFYSVGFRIASFHVLGVVMPLQLAFGPFVFGLIGKPGLGRTLGRTLTGFVWILGVTAAMLAMVAGLAVDLLAPDAYRNAEVVVLWTLPAGVFMGMYYWGAGLLHLAERTATIGRIVAVAALLCLSMNYVLVPPLGWLGAAIATDVSVLLAAIAVIVVGLRTQAVEVQIGPLGAGTVTSATLFAVAVAARNQPALSQVALAVAGLLTAVLVAHRFNLPTPRIAWFRRREEREPSQ